MPPVEKHKLNVPSFAAIIALKLSRRVTMSGASPQNFTGTKGT